MPAPCDAPEVLNRVFLDLRAKLLEVAAMLDRLERAEGCVADDPRMKTIRQALDLLSRRPPGDLAEEFQLLFSIPYDDEWRRRFDLAASGPSR